MKLLDVIKEHQERPLDNNFYRRVLNIIAQKFDLQEISRRLNNPNPDARWNATHEISRFAIMKDEETNYRDGIYLYLINTFELSEEEAKLIIFLLHKNIDVKDFLNDPLDTSLDFYVYSIFYYEDEIADRQDDERFDCERCGGSGWEYEECSQCDATGMCKPEIEGGEEDMCYDCEGSGEVSYDCSNCRGDCQIVIERWYAELSRRQMVIMSEEKLSTPKDQEEFLEWFYENYSIHNFQVVTDFIYDDEREEINEPGGNTDLEEMRGEIESSRTYKIKDRSELLKFTNFYL